MNTSSLDEQATEALARHAERFLGRLQQKLHDHLWEKPQRNRVPVCLLPPVHGGERTPEDRREFLFAQPVDASHEDDLSAGH